MKREIGIEKRILWKGGTKYFHVPNYGAHFKLVLQAIDAQSERDPTLSSNRSQRLMKSINGARDLIEYGNIQNPIDPNLYTSLLRPVLFSIMEDEIDSRIESLTEADLEPYRETTRRWKELHKRRDGK